MFCIDRNEFSTDYPKSEWEYLASGAMVKSEKFGLIHYPETDDELSLVARRGAQIPPQFGKNGP